MSLVDFSLSEDDFLKHFDSVVAALYSSSSNPNQQNQAQQLLVEFQQNQRAYTRVISIIMKSSSDQGKYIALSVLEELVNFRWKVLPPAEALGIKQFVQEFVVKLSNSENASELLLRKADKVLVDIAKHEWPEKWPTFLSDIVNSTFSSEGMARNNLFILRLLSEEIRDFSDRSVLISARAQALKNQLNREFSAVFDTCLKLLQFQGIPPDILNQTLLTLERYLPWVDLSYVFQSDLLKTLVEAHLSRGDLPIPVKTSILRCLSVVAEFRKITPHESTLCSVFVNILTALDSPNTMPRSAPIPQAIQLPGEARDFASVCAVMLSFFLKIHSELLESNPQSREAIPAALDYMIHFTTVSPDVEIFKTCVEYWQRISTDISALKEPHTHGRFKKGPYKNFNTKYSLYSRHLNAARDLLIDRMVRPEEVLINKDPETGEFVRVSMQETEETMLHRSMSETLMRLTSLNVEGTKASMDLRIRTFLTEAHGPTQSVRLDTDALNRFCWAAGAIAGVMPVDVEKSFFVSVLKKLLELCNQFNERQHRAVVASNIMYVCSQYPRFLRNQPTFLFTVCAKLIEFMKEQFPGIKEMAADTFLTIVRKCRKKFDKKVDDYILSIDEITQHLSMDLKAKVYEAVGVLIADFSKIQDQESRLEALVTPMNINWRNLMTSGATSGGETLNNPQVIQSFSNFLKINTALVTGAGIVYKKQMDVIFKDSLQIFKHYSALVSEAYSTQGAQVLRSDLIKSMRIFKKSLLSLLIKFFQIANVQDLQSVYVPALLPELLPSYAGSPPEFRDPEVLEVLSELVKKNGTFMNVEIMGKIFEPTLSMINQDYESFPDIRQSFFLFVQNLVLHSTYEIIKFGDQSFRVFIQTVIWACQHRVPNLAELGLNSLKDLIKKISHRKDLVLPFIRDYFLYVFHELFAILTDTFHKQSFENQVQVAVPLLQMFNTVGTNVIIDPSQPTGMSHKEFFSVWLTNILKQGYPNLAQNQIDSFVRSLILYSGDLNSIRNAMADFLILTRQWTMEEFERNAEQLEQQLLQQALQPQQRDEEM
ncbi:hypothetical protein RCL1_003255 [Eukaryota sp. TZLM3-RCL]